MKWIWCLLAWTVGVWCGAMGMLVTAGLCGLSGLPVGTGRRRALVATLGVVGAAICTPFELGPALKRLADRKHDYGIREVIGATGLNAVMAAGAAVCAMPEIALETMLLLRDGPSERSFRSSFAMRSERVRSVVREWAVDANGSGCRPREYAQTVVWKSYNPPEDALRVALATNPMRLRASTRSTDAGCALELEAHVNVRYPKTNLIPIGGDIVFDEGIFWGLQEVGVMHPYEAIWSWSVTSDDPQLDEVGVHLGWFEALVTAEPNQVRRRANQ